MIAREKERERRGEGQKGEQIAWDCTVPHRLCVLESQPVVPAWVFFKQPMCSDP